MSVSRARLTAEMASERLRRKKPSSSKVWRSSKSSVKWSLRVDSACRCASATWYLCDSRMTAEISSNVSGSSALSR